MRLLRELSDERTAQMLVDGLADSGVETELIAGRTPAIESANTNQPGRYAVWVLDETNLPRARELSESWLADEQSEAFKRAAARGRGARELKQRSDLRRRQQVEAATREFESLTRPRPTPLTWGLIALCVAVAVLTELGQARQMVTALTIANPLKTFHVSVFTLFGRPFEWLHLPWEEPWRLITPILVHFSPLHILFNMLWLRDLGRVVEARHGTRYLLVFVLACGILSNIAQYQLAQNALFAGMSGVVYGLLGLIWMRGRMDPRVGYGLSRFTVQFMLIWLLVGFLGDFGVANWCHLFGLLTGIVWGWVGARFSPTR
jgi:GlpG protein